MTTIRTTTATTTATLPAATARLDRPARHALVRAAAAAVLTAAAATLAGAAAAAGTVPKVAVDAVEDAAPRWQLSASGFVTLAAGKVLGGSADPATDAGYRCPCVATEYSQGGVYEAGAWRFGPDSKLGLQGTVARADGHLSLTAQAVSRGARDGRVDLEWLYGSVDLGSAWTVQVGRKRLPLLAQSEVQDVGYALPWVHLPPQVYGWEVVNYNGANLLYRGRWGSASALIDVFAGNETVKDSPLGEVYSGRDSRSDSRWRGIVGVETRIGLGAAELRGVYITSRTQNRYISAGDTDYSAPARQRIWGLSAAYDAADWVGRAEWLYVDRRQDYGTDHGALLAGGRRFGRWLPMLSWSRYREHTLAADDPPEGHDMGSLLLRCELDDGAAVKLQFDRWRDRSGAGFASPHGNRRLITAAYVRVF